MEIEPEVALQQMDDTRASLTEKLETLEQHVVDTVQGATSAVADTVETVKDAVNQTVGNVKDTLNLGLQVRRHPWGMMAGSVALGCLGGYHLFRNGSARSRASEGKSHPPSSENSRGAAEPNGVVKGPRCVDEASGGTSVPDAAPGLSSSGWLSDALDQFEPEITKLKGLVIGAVLSALRDVIIQSATEPMQRKLAEVMDSIMVKLGGEPTPGPKLKTD